MIDWLAELDLTPLTDEAPGSLKCASKTQTSFLKNNALKYQNLKISSTYLAFHQNQLVGYVTLCADALELSKEFSIKGFPPFKRLPAVKLAQMAIQKGLEAPRLEDALILFGISKAADVGDLVAVRFVTADVVPKRIELYQSNGFVANEPDLVESVLAELERGQKPDPKTVSLRFDLGGLEE